MNIYHLEFDKIYYDIDKKILYTYIQINKGEKKAKQIMRN